MIKQKYIYQAIHSLKGDIKTSTVFYALHDNSSLDKKIFSLTNDKGVNKVKRRIRWTFVHLKGRGFIEQVGMGKYKKIGDWTLLPTD